jgi:UDP-GlcNAc:undecaprenyl-phosphate GlcNAc-1-phosphate transferase
MFITMALVPILRMAALRLHAGIDVPDARKVHDHPVPKVGGLAMAVGALVPVILVADGGRFVNSVLIGACVIVVFGLADDLKNLGWRSKFAGQGLAASVVVFYGGLDVCRLGSCLPEGWVLPELAAMPLTLVAIVGVTNAINLSDGLDGLAGGTSLLIFICIGLLCTTGGDFPEKYFVMLLCTAAVGAIFGFLRFNTHPATVFMGDTGSQLLGFLAVTLALGITQLETTPLSPLLPLLMLGFPVLDTLTVMAERIAGGRSPFSPDKNHFHHKLMRLGLFHTEAVVAIYAITGLLVGAAFLLRFHSEWAIIAVFVLFSGAVIGLFTAAERRGFRFHRTGFFDTGIKARFKFVKDRHLLIRGVFLPLKYGLPVLFAAAVLLRRDVPGLLGAAAAGFAAAILLVRFLRRDWVDGALRIAFYLVVPLVLSPWGAGAAEWVAPAGLRAYNLAFGALAVVTVLTLKFTRRQKGFKATPMDFLILVIALVVPNLPDSLISGLKLGDVAVKTIVMYFSFEVLSGELRGELQQVGAGLLAGLGVAAARGIGWF